MIPAAVIDRPKGYFPVPGLKHLQGATLNWVREMLLDPSQERGLYNPQMLEKLLADPDGQLTRCAVPNSGSWRRSTYG